MHNILSFMKLLTKLGVTKNFYDTYVGMYHHTYIHPTRLLLDAIIDYESRIKGK